MKPRVGVFAGDPAGIGSELLSKLLAMPDVHAAADVSMIGGAAPKVLPGRVSSDAGEYVLASLRDAGRLLQANEIDAFCYAPLNKQAMKAAGMAHEDEMRYLASVTGVENYIGEVNVGPRYRTSRVTSHVPISEVARLITPEAIIAAARLLHDSLTAAGIANPRIAVAALNPHAGEGGAFGTEEITTIGPAIERLRELGVRATGPHPADTVFLAARDGRHDAVVTMYHDQGQIAMKLTGFERGVTLHGGMPWPITTPAHGTAFDIVGRGVANPGAMREAFLLAARMAAHNKTAQQTRAAGG